MLRILVIGGGGTIGKAVVKELSSRHEILVVGKSKGDLLCDIASLESIRSMYRKAGKFHAVAITAGSVHFEEISNMTAEKYEIGLKEKLMGQVNCVLEGMQHIADRGSFTLISGILANDPIKQGTSASMVNGAIESFVKASAIELPRNIRINAVSPTVVQESMAKYATYFRGFEPVEASRVALAFSKSIEGDQTGQIYSVI